jgi:hypothetical protein
MLKLVFLRLQTKFAILYQVVISEIFFRQNHLNKLSAFSPNVIFGIMSVHHCELWWVEKSLTTYPLLLAVIDQTCQACTGHHARNCQDYFMASAFETKMVVSNAGG